MKENQSYIERRECKFYSVVLKEFELHGKVFKPGQLITYKEASELIECLSNLGRITTKEAIYPKLETK
jgi:hypothetical protein